MIVAFIIILFATAYKLTVASVGVYARRRHARCVKNIHRLEIECGIIKDELVMDPRWSVACGNGPRWPTYDQESIKTARTFNDGRVVTAREKRRNPPPMKVDPNIEGYILR